VKNGIVFCNRKIEVDVVAKSLKAHGLDAAAIHGDLDQQTRMRTLDNFRKGELRLLVASDVAARGLDVPDVSHVFNYDVPHHADDYVHRIGRTGRAGRLGQTFMIVTPADSRNLDKVLKLIGQTPEEVTLDIDWSQIKEDGPRRGGARERTAGRGRADRAERPRREPRREAPAQATVEEAPVAAVAEPEAAPARKPRPEHSRRSEAPARRAASPERGDDDDRVVGFGSDIPSFLTRPTPLAKG
jgi:superfamily II DNA/RNA helicase